MRVERYDVLQEECLDIVWQSVEVVEETEEAPSNIEADTTTPLLKKVCGYNNDHCSFR
ncbi:MAG: hypothetical protein CM1200mP7_3690 [Chloroflexota bacterium]|nr:MAG: hypothetical protein CM1200mP7_3690 [Chloroflexota bacterium]